VRTENFSAAQFLCRAAICENQTASNAAPIQAVDHLLGGAIYRAPIRCHVTVAISPNARRENVLRSR
jgi:hypothetical protein